MPFSLNGPAQDFYLRILSVDPLNPFKVHPSLCLAPVHFMYICYSASHVVISAYEAFESRACALLMGSVPPASITVPVCLVHQIKNIKNMDENQSILFVSSSYRNDDYG